MHPYMNIAIKAARAAGVVITRAMDQMDRVQIENKGSSNDFVTSVDKKSEEEIIYHINKAYPDHAIHAEESGEKSGESEVTWIIDPLDGTLNFIHGFPYIAISIAVKYKNVIEHGLIYNPITGELFTATKGSGAQLDDKRIRVSCCPNIQTALLGTASLHRDCMTSFKHLLELGAGIRRTGAAALDLAYVAAGRLDGFLGSGLQPWDIAAGALLIREAGGYVSDFQGNSEYLQTGCIIAGSRKVYPTLLQGIDM